MTTRFSDLVVFMTFTFIEKNGYGKTINFGGMLEVEEEEDGNYYIRVSCARYGPNISMPLGIDLKNGVGVMLYIPKSYRNNSKGFNLIDEVYIDTVEILKSEENTYGGGEGEFIYEKSVYPFRGVENDEECKIVLDLFLLNGGLYVSKVEISFPKRVGDEMYRKFTKYDRMVGQTATIDQ